MEVGLFQIGKNAYIDKLAFKCGDMPRDARYPYVFIMGKRLKKGPEEYADVRKEVEKDLQLFLEREQLQKLKNRL